MPKVVLLSAKSGHGKDYSASYMKQKLESEGKSVAIIIFARHIKSYVKEYYGWDGTEETKPMFRTDLQQLGTEIIRQKLGWDGFLARRVCEDIKILSHKFDYFLIPDCRFRDEIDITLDNFPDSVYSIRINRLNYNSPLTQEQQGHLSEIALDDYNNFDFNISAGGLDELNRELDKILEVIK